MSPFLAGITFKKNLNTGFFCVTKIDTGCPAQTKIRVDDELVRCDNISVIPTADRSIEDVETHICGPLGSYAMLSLRRQLSNRDYHHYAVNLVRCKIDIKRTCAPLPAYSTEGTIAVRIVMLHGLRELFRIQKGLLQCMWSKYKRAFGVWKDRRNLQQQVKICVQK